MIATTKQELLDLLENLDGYGLVVTDSELLEETLDDWGYGDKEEERNPGLIYMEEKIKQM